MAGKGQAGYRIITKPARASRLSRETRSPPVFRESRIGGRYYIRLVGETPYSRLLLRGRHEAFSGSDEAMTPAFQRLGVADGGRVAPHLRVHRGGPEHVSRSCEDRGRE